MGIWENGAFLSLWKANLLRHPQLGACKYGSQRDKGVQREEIHQSKGDAQRQATRSTGNKGDLSQGCAGPVTKHLTLFYGSADGLLPLHGRLQLKTLLWGALGHPGVPGCERGGLRAAERRVPLAVLTLIVMDGVVGKR